MGLMKAEQSRTGRGWGSRGDLFLGGAGLSHFLITSNRSQFHMTTPTTHMAQCLTELTTERGGRVNVPLGL